MSKPLRDPYDVLAEIEADEIEEIEVYGEDAEIMEPAN